MTDKLTYSEISKAVDPKFQEVACSLLDPGIESSAIDAVVAESLGYPETDARVTTARMNLVGGLRAAGYIVTGGRHGGSLYKIVGFEEKKSRPTVDQWDGLPRSTYDWIHSLDPLTDGHWTKVREQLARRQSSEVLHETSWMYLWCYEAARDLAWYITDGITSSAVILQRHRNVPRFRLFELRARPEWLLQVGKQIARASTHPVSIINCRLETTSEFKALDPRGSWSRRTEAIYDVKDIAEHPEKYLNARAMTTFRKRERECRFYLEPSSTTEVHQLNVIETWKKLNESKHRQLAIERDRKAVRIEYPLKITFGGDRLGFPVIHHLFDRLPNAPSVVALINEKSLNYPKFEDGSEVPGGAYGLSDYNQIMSCRALQSLGIEYIQSGGIDGGGVGLTPKKKKYACSFVESQTFHTSFETGAPK